MDSTTIPLTHVQTGLTIIGIFVAAGTAAFGAAWAGVKLAIAPLKLEITLNKEASKKEIEAVKEGCKLEFDAIKDDRKRRGEAIAQLNEAIQLRVLVSSCMTAQAACGRYNSMRIESISKQVDDMAVDVKETTRLLAALNATFEERTKHFEALENIINERSNQFRPPTAGDRLS